jgi:hypothetical protein
MKRKSLSVFTALVCILFLSAGVNGRAQEGPEPKNKLIAQGLAGTSKPIENPRMRHVGVVVIADLNVTPLTYTGPCPATFTLKGQIYANKATTVHYKLLRSDNAPMKPVELKFDKEERKEITFTWQLGDPAGSAVLNEWALIEAIYPINQKIRSNAAFLKGSCGDQSNIKAQDAVSPMGGQKMQPGPPMGTLDDRNPPPLPGPSMGPSDQKGLPPATGNVPAMPPIQKGPGPGSMPMPGQTGPMPSSFPPSSVSGPGPVPGSLPVPQPMDKEILLPGSK